MNRRILTKKSERGQGLVEYILTAILAGLIGAGVWMAFGPEIKALSADLTERVSGGYSVNDGVLNIPGLSPSLTPVTSAIPTDASTPIASAIPTNTPTLIASSTPTNTPTLIASSTPTQLACTPGNAIHVRSKSACKDLRDINNCDDFNYSSKKDTCSWY